MGFTVNKGTVSSRCLERPLGVLPTSGSLNRDRRCYLCDWPHIVRYPEDDSLSCDTPPPLSMILFVRGRPGELEERGGWKSLKNDTPHKKGFWTVPLVRYVFQSPQVSVLCFQISCAKIHDRADHKLFWRGPKLFLSTFSGTFSSPHTFCTPHITAQVCLQFWESLFAILVECSHFCLRSFLIQVQEEINNFAVWEGG